MTLVVAQSSTDDAGVTAPAPGSVVVAGFEAAPDNPGNVRGACVVELAEGWDLGDPKPIIRQISSLLVDGTRQTGRRTDDRQMVLPITIKGPDRLSVASCMSALLAAVDAQTWTLIYTPPGNGLPVVYDCFRTPMQRDYTLDLNYLDDDPALAWCARTSLTPVALPFGRDPDRTTITAGGTALLLDSLDSVNVSSTCTVYDAVTGITNTVTITADTAQKVQGTASNRARADTNSGHAQLATVDIVHTMSSTDLSDYASIGVNASLQYANIAAQPSAVTCQITVRDSTGASAIATSTHGVTATDAGLGVPVFALLTVPLPTGPVDLTDVVYVSYVLQWTQIGASPLTSPVSIVRRVTAWVDNLRAYQPTDGQVTTGNGGTYRVPNVPGDAPAPVSVTATVGGGITALVLHQAPDEARPDYSPLIKYASDGYTVNPTGTPAPMPSLPGYGTNGVRFNGTCRVLLGGVAIGGGEHYPEDVRVDVIQSFNDGISGSITVSTHTVTLHSAADLANGMLDLGFITLPGRDVPLDNTNGGLNVAVYATPASGSSSLTVQDVLILDTRGTSVYVENAYGRDTIWVDEPGPTATDPMVYMGNLLASGHNGRASAVTVLDTTIPAGVFQMHSGTNLLLAYSPQGSPSIDVSLAGRWRYERTG